MWANDFDGPSQLTYEKNHPETVFELGDIKEVCEHESFTKINSKIDFFRTKTPFGFDWKGKT